ncbi:GNAT family N-acetyltransferase [Legionella yabuuchiae]|uniref:GNAT family N-acetyltransferase n=1 Tax=Legionella yabuuchiae TaxID=376727 RepID=UPI0010550556|nr:GNAT family N-acetyltransferase [Legionella yabuuchiae]
MIEKIIDITKSDQHELIELWEKSVRATHDFLKENDIKELKPLILNQYFDKVTLKGIKNKDSKWIGFIGVASNKIEMLFISLEYQGQGVGSLLCKFAIKEMNVDEVDVNEENPKARRFYEKMGFKVIARSPLDGQGKPYPLLHMKLIEYEEIDPVK